MMNQNLVFSEARQTWNVFVDGEWYFEGTYEQCETVMWNNAMDDCPDEVEIGDYAYDEYDEEEPDFSEEQDTSILYGRPEDADAFGGGRY